MIETLGEIAIGFMIGTIGWYVFMAMDNYLDNIGEQQSKRKQKPQFIHGSVDYAFEIKKLLEENAELRRELDKVTHRQCKQEFNDAIRDGDFRKINAMANRYKVDSDE